MRGLRDPSFILIWIHALCLLISIRTRPRYLVLSLSRIIFLTFLHSLPRHSFSTAIMKFTQTILPLALSALGVASPTPTLDKRATTVCGQWDSVSTGTYIVYQDLWDEAAATSGSQCTTVDSDTSGTLVWSTSWTWEGGSSDVKSYANAAITPNKQLSTISSIPSTWKWSYVSPLPLQQPLLTTY